MTPGTASDKALVNFLLIPAHHRCAQMKVEESLASRYDAKLNLLPSRRGFLCKILLTGTGQRDYDLLDETLQTTQSECKFLKQP